MNILPVHAHRLLTLALATIAITSVASSAPAETNALSDLTPLLESHLKKSRVPAMVAAVVQGDHVVAIGAAGVRKAGSSVPVTVADKFHIGSCTKSMTATLAAMLVEQGRISWRTTIGESFPEFGSSINPAYRTVTLDQLLSHRGGLPTKADPAAWSTAFKMRGTPMQQRLQFIRAILAKPPEAAPGTKFIYSNQGFAVAGAMLEKVSGEPYEVLLRKRLFEPLGMTSAGFGAPATEGRIDQPWGHIKDMEPVEPGPRADNPPAITPAGRVNCSIGDLAKYVAFHLNDGRNKPGLLKPESFEKLHTPAAGQDYALGWGVTRRGWANGPALTHAGCNTMFFTVLWLAPRKQFAIIVETNYGGDEAAKFCDGVAAALVGKYCPR